MGSPRQGRQSLPHTSALLHGAHAPPVHCCAEAQSAASVQPHWPVPRQRLLVAATAQLSGDARQVHAPVPEAQVGVGLRQRGASPQLPAVHRWMVQASAVLPQGESSGLRRHAAVSTDGSHRWQGLVGSLPGARTAPSMKQPVTQAAEALQNLLVPHGVPTATTAQLTAEDDGAADELRTADAADDPCAELVPPEAGPPDDAPSDEATGCDVPDAAPDEPAAEVPGASDVLPDRPPLVAPLEVPWLLPLPDDDDDDDPPDDVVPHPAPPHTPASQA